MRHSNRAAGWKGNRPTSARRSASRPNSTAVVGPSPPAAAPEPLPLKRLESLSHKMTLDRVDQGGNPHELTLYGEDGWPNGLSVLSDTINCSEIPRSAPDR